MTEVGKMKLPPHHSAEEIFAHPRFPAARNALMEAMLGLYEHDAFLNRLLLQVGRNVLFVVIMCLHARYDEDDPATWPTLQVVKESMTAFRLSSPRRVADLVSRLIKTGYLEQVSSPRDRRIRILTPTEKMILQDQDWLISHYVPLQLMFPDPGYALIMERNRDFQRVQRLVAVDFFPYAAQLMARHPIMLHFMAREAGVMTLIKLLQLAGPDGHTARAIFVYSDIGARFGVSRTQVRKLLEDAEKDGLVRLVRGKDNLVQLAPRLIEAFDRFIADGMAGHDLMYQLAMRATATEAAGSRSMQSVPLSYRSTAS